VVWSFAYLAVRGLFGLVLLLGRSDRSKELEILVCCVTSWRFCGGGRDVRGSSQPIAHCWPR
jgi:hypothetical protein